jgi:VWFA-related protein
MRFMQRQACQRPFYLLIAAAIAAAQTEPLARITVNLVPPAHDAAPATAPVSQASPAPPSVAWHLTPAQVTRTIAVVVDDLGMNEDSLVYVHRALSSFLDAQWQPGDLMAIITTSGRLGALQQLTGDRRILHAAIDKIRLVPMHRSGVLDPDFNCIWYDHVISATESGRPTGAGTQDEDAFLGKGRGIDELVNDRRSEYYSRLSVSALLRVVDGLRGLPGHKSIMLFSEGVPLIRASGAGEPNDLLIEAYNAFLDHANRSGVAVNTIDPRGLLTPFQQMSPFDKNPCVEARTTELVNSQKVLDEMARRTGGISIKNDNDYSGAIARVMQDQLGYYLISHKPSRPRSKPGKDSPLFHKISVRVARAGLKVRFHSSRGSFAVYYPEYPRESIFPVLGRGRRGRLDPRHHRADRSPRSHFQRGERWPPQGRVRCPGPHLRRRKQASGYV